MQIRWPIDPQFDRGIKPDHLWGHGKHTFCSDEGAKIGGEEAGQGEDSTDPFSVDIGSQPITGDSSKEHYFDVFGITIVSTEPPKVRVDKFGYSGDPQAPVLFSGEVNGIEITDQKANTLPLLAILKANPELVPHLEKLALELRQKGLHNLEEQVRKYLKSYGTFGE